MSLFKKKEAKMPASACNSNCPSSEMAERKPVNPCRGEQADGIRCIKVLGSGCKSCHALLQATEKAVTSMGLTIEVEYITDMQTIMEYGIMRTPALIVNEQIISTGKVLSAEKIAQLLHKFTG